MTAAKKNRRGAGGTGAGVAAGLPRRSWAVSVIVAAVVLAVTLTLSATINPLFGRAVHWDWVAFIAPVAFIGVLLSTRNRWV